MSLTSLSQTIITFEIINKNNHTGILKGNSGILGYMNDAPLVKIWGMTLVFLSYIVAASQGHDGLLFTAVVTILAGAIGLEVGFKKGGANVKKRYAIISSIDEINS